MLLWCYLTGAWRNTAEQDRSTTHPSACIIVYTKIVINHLEGAVDLETVNYLHDGAVAIIKLNRPQAGNALSAQLASDLKAAASAARADQGVRACVFSAEGNVFSFGGDLKEFLAFGG